MCGAAVTLGAVGEPFLSFTPQVNILADRLCRGYAFGDSAYMSLQVVSWQITVIGDSSSGTITARMIQIAAGGK